MSILFDQIKNRHYSLLDSLFKGQEQNIQDGINVLFESVKEFPETEGLPNAHVAYLQEIHFFWEEFYQELQKEKITSQDEKYQLFRRMGQKLQMLTYYDVAADLLCAATSDWNRTTIHLDVLVKWKTLADDMRELRRCCNEIRHLNGRPKTRKAQKLLIDTQMVVRKAQRSLKSSGNDSDEIRDAIKLLRNLDQNIPPSENGEWLKARAKEVYDMRGVVREALLMKLSAIETINEKPQSTFKCIRAT